MLLFSEFYLRIKVFSFIIIKYFYADVKNVQLLIAIKKKEKGAPPSYESGACSFQKVDIGFTP